jgi:signal transduction histidine kinase
MVIGTVLASTMGMLPLKPVNKIINTLNRLAGGDYRARLNFNGPLGRNRTIREITDSFNAMAAELENTEMLRSDFINNFSHEFKTPIVSIAGFAKLLKRGNLSEEERLEYLDIIERESLRLSDMATNVLNMTKVENRRILTDVTTFNLSEQLRNCVLLLEEKWTKKDLNWDIDLDEHMISGNEELLREVWVNLLDNAIKFSPAGETVTITVQEEQEQTQVSVTNRGSEIDPARMDRIFQKFYQGDPSHTAEGNGIGLAIVKRVTELHGGSVRAASRDGSTCFTVTLPNSPRQSAQ